LKALIVVFLTSLFFNGCSIKKWFNKDELQTHTFKGFVKYEKPKKVELKVFLECVGREKLQGEDLALGNCVRIEEVERLVIRAKILEKMVDNYSMDIDSYNQKFEK
jgi:hypothetical protein